MTDKLSYRTACTHHPEPIKSGMDALGEEQRDSFKPPEPSRKRNGIMHSLSNNMVYAGKHILSGLLKTTFFMVASYTAIPEMREDIQNNIEQIYSEPSQEIKPTPRNP